MCVYSWRAVWERAASSRGSQKRKMPSKSSIGIERRFMTCRSHRGQLSDNASSMRQERQEGGFVAMFAGTCVTYHTFSYPRSSGPSTRKCRSFVRRDRGIRSAGKLNSYKNSIRLRAVLLLPTLLSKISESNARSSRIHPRFLCGHRLTVRAGPGRKYDAFVI